MLLNYKGILGTDGYLKEATIYQIDRVSPGGSIIVEVEGPTASPNLQQDDIRYCCVPETGDGVRKVAL